MKLYKDVLKSAKEAKTIAAHIKAFGKIRAKTEDKSLFDKIDKAIDSLQTAHAIAKKGKSTPTCLDKATNIHVTELIEHCKKAVADGEPEWQVIAKRNGWGPKT